MAKKRISHAPQDPACGARLPYTAAFAKALDAYLGLLRIGASSMKAALVAEVPIGFIATDRFAKFATRKARAQHLVDILVMLNQHARGLEWNGHKFKPDIRAVELLLIHTGGLKKEHR